MKKPAFILWTIGSIAFFILLLLYVFVYQPTTGLYSVRINQMLENWPLVANIWRAESLAAVMLAVSAGSFALDTKNLFWILVAVGHIIMILMFAFMLGSYSVAAEYHDQVPALFPLVNETALWIFAFSNLLFLSGMAGIYHQDTLLKRWLSRIGLVIALLGIVIILTIFFGWLTFSQYLVAGPIITLLHLINACYGFRGLRKT
jgi:hypothetical protein